MSGFVSSNRLRSHIACGSHGSGGSAADASGEVAIEHTFGATGVPTVFGATLGTSGAGGTAQTDCHVLCRLSAAYLVIQIVSAGAARASSSVLLYWWAKM